MHRSTFCICNSMSASCQCHLEACYQLAGQALSSIAGDPKHCSSDIFSMVKKPQKHINTFSPDTEPPCTIFDQRLFPETKSHISTFPPSEER